jgi:NUMOD4 motif
MTLVSGGLTWSHPQVVPVSPPSGYIDPEVRPLSLETWCDVPGFELLYEVARDGRVRSLDRLVPQASRWGHTVRNRHEGRVLTPYICKNGRKRVVLHDAAHQRHLRYVDDLVREAFPAGSDS